MARILLAEDDTSMREYLQRALQRVGYEVEAVGCGTEAVPLLEATHFDLLLTDIVMPGMNGRQLADALQRRQPELKVLFITGYSRNAIVHQGRLDAGVSLLQKPLSRAMLASKIREILDGPRGASGQAAVRS